MAISLRWTVSDLELFPDDGKLREIIDGEMYVSTQPHWHHQESCVRVSSALHTWSDRTGLGQANISPSVIFSPEDAVAPDVVWISKERLAVALDDRGKLRAAPDLVVEMLSPGAENERRDREAKLKLYSRWGVREYWIMSWQLQQVEIWRRQEAALSLAATLASDDELSSPLLPGFIVKVASLFGAPSA